MEQRIEVSPRTIILIIAILVILWLAYLVRDLILLLFIAFVFAAALNPLVEYVRRAGIPRVAAVAIVVLGIFAFFALLAAVGIVPFISQFDRLVESLIVVFEHIRLPPFISQPTIESTIRNFSQTTISFIFSLLGNIVAFVSTIVFTIYFLLEREDLERSVMYLAQKKIGPGLSLTRRIEGKLGAWVRGQFLISLSVGVLYFIALTAIGINFALPLAIIGGLLEVIPFIGPILAALPAGLLALMISPFKAALVAAVYLLIQQVEGNILVPQVMKRTVGLNPLLVLIAIAVGARVFGFLGVIIAVPATLVLQIILAESWFKKT